MRVATIISLGASAVLGLGALFVARIWLPAQAARPGARVVVAAAPGVPVVLAAGQIAYGAKLQARDLVLIRLPADAAPPGAFSSIDQVMKLDGGGAPVALAAMSPREAVLAAKLSGPGARPTLAALIGEGMRAYTIGVTDVAGGGGHVMPGDRVDVVLTRDVGAAMEGGRGKLISAIVIQSVRVLGMDLNVDPNSVHPVVAHTATLEVNVQDAERLALAAQAGTLSLALRRAGSAEVETVRPMLTSDLGPGGGAVAAAPRAASVHRGRPSAGRMSAPGSAAGVIVINGESRARPGAPADAGV